ESDPRVPLILGRPFLRTARALIDVHDEEIILRDDDERLTLNMKHDTASYSNHPQREFVNLINIFNVSSKDFLEVFSMVNAFPSPNNEDKVFNPGIIIQEKSIKIITRVAQDKKLAISNASLVFDDFDPPFYEPLFFKDVPKSKILL
nr:reverse transcriptase domain-containing protein [Tanacetum cinerariifolium]